MYSSGSAWERLRLQDLTSSKEATQYLPIHPTCAVIEASHGRSCRHLQFPPPPVGVATSKDSLSPPTLRHRPLPSTLNVDLQTAPAGTQLTIAARRYC